MWPDRHAFSYRRKSLGIYLLLLLGAGSSLAAQDLRFRTDQSLQRVRGREASGHVYYSLPELAAILGLELVPGDGRTAEVRGPRGSLILTEGRPLLRFREEYILLSAAVRKATDGNWFVPEDILEKGLAQVTDRKLEKTERSTYRIETLDSNVVRVDLVNYPDHVAVIFSSSKEAPFRVREFRQHLRVEFEGYSIQPQITGVAPNQELIREVRFDALDQYGSFEIVKGDDYYTYRQYSLTGPDRQVVGVYGRPASTVARGPGRPAVETLDPPPLAPDPLPRSDHEAPEFSRDRGSRIITLDPGHGSDDLGVLPTPEVREAQIAWQVSEQIREFLGLARHASRLTRAEGLNPSLEQRSAQSNGDRSRAFVSIHVGAAETEAVRGPVVYVHRYFDRGGSEESTWIDWNEGQRGILPQSRRLAAILQRKLNLVFGVGNEAAEAPLAVLAPVQAPAVLIELGFLSNAEDRAQLQSPEFLRQVAAAIASGLEEFLE